MINEINYLGKSHYFKTPFPEASKEEIELVKKNIHYHFTLDDVREQLKDISNGKNIDKKILEYFLFDIMCKTKRDMCKWTVEEFMQNDDLISYMIYKFKTKPNLYKNDLSLGDIRRFFNIGGLHLAVTPTKFKLKYARDILKKYNVNNVYYDFSCGWASRMLASLSENITYFGTDPNYLLVDKLNEIHNLYNDTNNLLTITDIKKHGSEIFVNEWENKVGVAFSSPPYFNCESYRIGKQSYIEGVTTYDEWKNNYLFPTIDNIRRYLIDDGYFLINVKNISNKTGGPQKIFHIEDDVKDYALKHGFYFVCFETLKVGKRPHFIHKTSSDENIIVFKKQ